MINAPYEKEFVFHDGRRAKNLLELSSMLENIGQQDFERFVNTSKNDFANWIEYVLLDKELASSLRSTILFPKTKELISNKIKIENSSRSSLNDASNGKKSLLKILSPVEKNPFVEVRKPIEKLPEPGHHEMLPAPEKKRWFRRKDKVEDSKKLPEVHTYKEIKEINNGPDKDKNNNNPLRKWYQFNKRKHVASDAKNGTSTITGGNISWILLYCIVIFAIIAIIVYKFVL